MNSMDEQTIVGQSLSEPIQRFWTGFIAQQELDPTARLYEVFHFDDCESNANELGELVVAGTKQATASLVWTYDVQGKPRPEPGHLSIVTNWQGEPLCVIETTRVDVVPFNEVSEEFAAVEGEGDGSLRHWLAAHKSYFARECERLNRKASEDMPVMCERFKVVYLSPEA